MERMMFLGLGHWWGLWCVAASATDDENDVSRLNFVGPWWQQWCVAASATDGDNDVSRLNFVGHWWRQWCVERMKSRGATVVLANHEAIMNWRSISLRPLDLHRLYIAGWVCIMNGKIFSGGKQKYGYRCEMVDAAFLRLQNNVTNKNEPKHC